MKEPEYTEGPKALENFEKMATAVFQAPKQEGRKARKKSSKQASERKPKNPDEELGTHSQSLIFSLGRVGRCARPPIDELELTRPDNVLSQLLQLVQRH
jgi:hypothetical protein